VTRRRGGRSPLVPTRPALVLGLVGAALYGVARSTGSGWLVVLLSGLLATLALAAVLPWVPLRRVRVGAAGPPDATVHRPFLLTLTVAGRASGLRLVPVDPAGAEVALDAPAAGEVEVVARRRDVLRAVTLELRSSGPLGLVTWRRRLEVTLDRAVEVGPWPSEEDVAVPARAGAFGSEVTSGGGRDGDLTRSARAYVPGDPLRLLHWPATARTGTLMVRELETPSIARLSLVVDLRPPGESAEEAASRAAGLALAAMRHGIPVTLLTAEAGSPVVARVGSPVEVGRRLARAVSAAPPTGPVEDGAVVLRVGAGPG